MEELVREIARLLDEAERLSLMCDAKALDRIEEAEELAAEIAGLLKDEKILHCVLWSISRAELKVRGSLDACMVKKDRWWRQ